MKKIFLAPKGENPFRLLRSVRAKSIGANTSASVERAVCSASIDIILGREAARSGEKLRDSFDYLNIVSQMN